jgi:polysaccharide chain length determinant protein (PEP-CTERM system associated)
MNVDGGIQINDIGGIIRRRGKVAAATALGIFLASYWLAMALPNVYTSYSTVLVEPQSVDPDLVSGGGQSGDLNERLHLMTAQILSRPRLSRIIDEEGLYKEESGWMLREEIIDLMRERVRVEPVIADLEEQGRRREVEIKEFQILFDDYDPIVARDVAQRLGNDFIDNHIEARVQISQKSMEFIEGELERLAERIRKVESEIAQVKNENPGMLPEDMTTSQRRMERIQMDLTSAQRVLNQARSDEEFYKSQLAAAAAWSAGNDDASPERRLELLKLQLAEFEARGFTAKHPDVVKTKVEIEALEGTIEIAADSGMLMNPVQQQAEASLRRAQLETVSAESEIARLTLLGEEIQSQLAGTPAVAEQLDVLNRQYEHLFDTFQDFSRRHNEATVTAQLERRQLGEQFRVLEQAFVAPEPSAPNRILIMALGAVFGLMIGGAVGSLLEAVDTSPHDARQLQTRVQLPVLASIPEIWLESDRVDQRRARVRASLATVGLVMFALVGGAANYFWVNGAPSSRAAEASEAAESEAAVQRENEG